MAWLLRVIRPYTALYPSSHILPTLHRMSLPVSTLASNTRIMVTVLPLRLCPEGTHTIPVLQDDSAAEHCQRTLRGTSRGAMKHGGLSEWYLMRLVIRQWVLARRGSSWSLIGTSANVQAVQDFLQHSFRGAGEF